MRRHKILLVASVLSISCLERLSAATTAVNDPAVIAALRNGDAGFLAFDNKAALEAYGGAVAIDSSNYEALWKLARAYVDVGQAAKGDEQKQNFFMGEKIARRCVALHPDSAESHFFLAVAVGRVGLVMGGKKKIALSREFKSEIEKTLAINPDHHGAMYGMGQWNFELANLSWFLRTAAKIIYGGVPTGASNEEAKTWLEKAIALAPEMPLYHLWLGEVLIELNDYENARMHLQTCLGLPDVFWDDPLNKAQAGKRLEDIKRKK